MYLFCIFSYVSVRGIACHYIKRRFIYYLNKFIAIIERRITNASDAIADYNARK